MPHQFTTCYVEDSLAILRLYKRQADGAMSQLTGDQLFVHIDEESNSIAIIVKHVAGNMRSRFLDFLTRDGEKPDRDRDSEFVDPPASRDALLKLWEEGWGYVFDALTPLGEGDLGRTVMIRGEPHSVMQAINRQVAHYASHIGQIIFLAKHLQGKNWKTVTIPRNRSADFTRRVAAGEASQR